MPEELRRYWHISASAHSPRPQAKSPPHSECRGLNFVFLLRKYLAHETGSCACGVGLIGIDVHCQRILRADSDDDIAENERTAVGVDLDADYLLVLKTVFLGILGSCVDVSLRCDNAALKLYFALGADKLAGAAARNVAALSDRSSHAYRTGVGERNLNLILGTHGAEDGDRREATLRSDNGNTLVARELAGLRELLLDGQLIALAEEDIESFSGDMYMARGSFNKNFLFKYPSFSLDMFVNAF